MKQQLILAVDQGTTNSKALLMDRGGTVAARSSRPLSISFPQPGWVEQDAQDLWQSVVEAINECLERAGDVEIVAAGVTNQRESIILWDRQSGKPAGPCLIWQCRRTAPLCSQLRERGFGKTIQERSGLAIDPLFSASKAAWLLDNVQNGRARAERGELCAGTVDSWLLWNLTGGKVHATDATNASRTQLLDLKSARWDPELMELFRVPMQCLPEVRESSSDFGRTVAHGRLPSGIPIRSMIGDSHAAFFAHGEFEPGSIKATYGTGSSLMTLTERMPSSSHGLSSTIAWALRGRVWYALEGNITNTGGAVQWLGEFLSLKDPAGDAAALASAVSDHGGVYVIPAFAGLGAPHWDPGARGLIFGLTRGSSAAHVARATVDSIAYQVRDVFEGMREDSGIDFPVLLADGGASRNASLMQFQADILNRPVVCSDSPDLSACGAAWLAGLGAGFWASSKELAALTRAGVRFEPNMEESRRAELIAGWNDALDRSRSNRDAAKGESVQGLG